MTATGSRPTRPVTYRFHDRNAVLVVVGIALVLASIQGLQWYDVDQGRNVAGGGFTFVDLRENAQQLGAVVTEAYFRWLSVVVLVLGGLSALAATVPSRRQDPLRVAGFGFGLLGVVATYYALAQLFNAQQAAGGSAHGVLTSSTFGVWAALGGFALIALGGALGPRRV